MQIHIAVEVTFTVVNNTVHSSQSILLNHVITLGQFINKCFMLSVSGRKLTCAVSSSVYMKDIRWLVTKNTCLFTVEDILFTDAAVGDSARAEKMLVVGFAAKRNKDLMRKTN